MPRRRIRGFLATCALSCVAASADAQDDACHGTGLSQRDELRLTPPDGADAVALDAPVVLVYAPDVDVDALLAGLEPSDVCGGALACLIPASGGGAPPVALPSSLERLDARSFVLRPQRLLPARTELSLIHARPGFDRPTRGQAAFRTGDDVDREPPELSADTAQLDLRVEPPPAPCEAPAGSLRVRLTVPTPEDDGDAASVEVLAYLSRSARDAAPVLRARARAEDTDDASITLTLFLEPEEASGPICVALRAIDGVGRGSRESPESCFDPGAAEQSVFAPSCAAGLRAGAAARRDVLAGALLLSVAAVLSRRRVRDRRTSTVHRRTGARA